MQDSWRVTRRTVCFGAALLLLGAVTGCGGKGKISGAVTGPDGQPLPLGRITFTPASGNAVSTDIEGGKYTAENVATGEAKVSVETRYIEVMAKAALPNSNMGGQGTGGAAPQKGMPPQAAAALEEMNKNRAKGIEHAKQQLAKYKAIPDKFTDPKTSGLSLTVKSGSNTFPVDLSKK